MKFQSRLRQTTISTGLDDIELSGTPLGFNPFSTLGENGKCFYTIDHKNDYEIGIGHYFNDGLDKLSRDLVIESSNENEKVSFTDGIKIVYATVPAAIFNSSVGIDIVTANTTLDYSFGNILVNNSGSINLQLPPANDYESFSYSIKKLADNNHTVNILPEGAEQINGLSSLSLFVKNDLVKIISDGSNWHVLQNDLLPHLAKMVRNTAQLIPNTSTTKILLNSVRYDRGGVCDLGNNNFLIRRTNKYHITANMGFSGGLTSDQELWIAYFVNNILQQWQLMSTGAISSSAAVQLSETISLNVNDVVHLSVWQGTGSSRNTNTTEQYMPKISLEEII